MAEFDYSELRGVIRAKFGTNENFAKTLGISQYSLYERLNNRVSFKQDEIMRVKKMLRLSSERVDEFFFTEKIRKTK